MRIFHFTVGAVLGANLLLAGLVLSANLLLAGLVLSAPVRITVAYIGHQLEQVAR